MTSNVKIWGPNIWYVIHKISFSLPQTENPLSPAKKSQVITFYRSLGQLLPCQNCRVHYNKMLKTHDLVNNASSGKKLAKWTVKIHNLVNNRLNKATMSYDIALSIYKNKKVNHSKLQKYINYILVSSGEFPLNNRKSNAQAFIQNYYCPKCKLILIKYLADNSLEHINNQNDMTNWSKRLLALSKKPC